MKHQVLVKERKELHKRIQKKMWFKTCFTHNLETMSFVNMMTKFGWHSSALSSHDEEFDDFKVKLLYLSGYNKYCYPEIEDSCIWTKKYLETIGCSILKIRNSQDLILL